MRHQQIIHHPLENGRSVKQTETEYFDLEATV